MKNMFLIASLEWTMTDFTFLGSRITADSDWRHEIKRCLLLGRKAMTNLDSILKSRDTTLLTKVCIVKAMVFPVVMYTCESWTIKKAEHRRTDAPKTLESPLDSKEKSTLNIHWKDWCWSWSSNTLATWCKELTHWKRPWYWEKIEARRRRGWQRMRWLDGIIDSTDMNLSKLRETVRQGSLVYCSPWGCKESEWLNDWTTTAMRFLKALAIYWQYGAIVSLSPPPTHAYTYSCYTVGSY